jgi:hypothetical protein
MSIVNIIDWRLIWRSKESAAFRVGEKCFFLSKEGMEGVVYMMRRRIEKLASVVTAFLFLQR